MNALKLCAKYSYITNQLGYCGPTNAKELLYDFVTGKNNDEQAIAEALKKFEGLYPYLEFIAEKNNREPFDLEVVEAYWLGNELLEDFEKKDYVKLIRALVARGLPAFVANEVLSKLKENPVPHHSFNVLFVGVGRVTGSVPTTLENMDKCLIHAGEVLELANNKIIVNYKPLTFNNNTYSFGEEIRKDLHYDKAFVGEPEPGELVSFHWNTTVQRISEKVKKNIEKYNNRNLRALEI